MIKYHIPLIYTWVSPQVLIFQKNNCAQTPLSMLSMSGHYNFFEKLKIMGKNRGKLNCSCDKVSPALKAFRFCYFKYCRKISTNQFLRCTNARLSQDD